MSSSKANLILYNANVLTMEQTNPHAESIATGDGRIIGVGSNRDCEGFRGKQTELIDCSGQTIAPGFNDAHMHVFALVSSLLSLDCGPYAVSSIKDIQRLIAARAAEASKGNWIKGTEYNEFYLAEKRHPNRHDLDRAAPNHPVKLAHRTRLACVLNSMALSLAGITAETPDPPDGLIDRDNETGEPTGLLFGFNTHLTERVIPPRSAEELDEGIRQANQLLLSSGITSLQDATSHNGLTQWEQFLKIKGEGKLKSRITMMFGFDALRSFQEAGLDPRKGDDNLRLGMMKILIDETKGPLHPPQDVLNGMVLAAHQAGFQVAIHAIEENTVKSAISALEYALRRMPGADHRHRIEHCSECPPNLLRRLKETRATVVTQPAFIYYSGERYLSEVAPSKVPWLYRTGSMMNNGIAVAASSDGPVIPMNPLTGIYAAVTRRAESGQALSPHEAASAWQALWMYTMGGAYASFEDHIKGSIATGKLADLVILSNDPLRVPVEEIKDIAVEKTIIGGKIVWERSPIKPNWQ